MSFDLRDLYQQTILDHGKNPRNSGALEGATHQARGHNPLCGDRLDLHLRVVDGKVQEAAFTGNGCAISTASASMMTEMLKDLSVEEIDQLFRKFQAHVTGQDDREETVDSLGKLAVFAGVRDFPTRVKCATLAWHTLKAALESRPAAVSTE